MKRPSLEQRKLQFLENACATCGGSDDGGGADASIPNEDPTTAPGEDNLVKALASIRRKTKKNKPVKEEAKPRPTAKMIMKAGQLEMQAAEEKDREKKFPLYDRIRKIKMKAVDD